MSRSFVCALLAMGVTLGQSLTTAQQLDESAKAARLETLVYRNPQPGTAFDLWIQHFLDAGQREELLALTDRKAAEGEANDFRPHLVRGMVARRLGQSQLAVDALQQARDLAPNQYLPRWILAEELVRSNRLPEATAELSAALELPRPRAHDLAITKLLAATQRRMGERTAAVLTLGELADRFRDDPRVTAEIATVLQHDGEFQTAASLWRRVEQLAGNDPFQRLEAGIRIAQADLAAGKAQAAIDRLATELDRVQSDSWYARQIRELLQPALRQAGGTDAQAAFWRARVERRPQDWDAWLALADAQSAQGRTDEAIETLRSASTSAPSRRDLREGLIRLLQSTGQTSEAVIQTRQLAEQSPNDAVHWIRLGELILGDDQLDRATAVREAIDAWQHVPSLRDDDPTLPLQVAEACLRAAGLGVNEVVTSAASQSSTTFAVAEDDRPLLLAAEQNFRTAIARDPRSPQYREYLGRFLRRTGRRTEALDAVREATDPDAASEWNDAARIFADWGEIEAALESAERALALDNSDVDSLLHVMRLAQELNETERAISAASDWLGQHPNHERAGEVIRSLVETYVEANQVEQAIAEATQRAADHPNDVESRWTIAALYSSRGTHDEAIRWMEQAVAIRDQDPRLLSELATLCEQSNSPRRAAEILRRLVETDPQRQREYLRQLAELFLRLDRLDDAADAIQQWLEAAPTDVDAHLLLATLNYRRSDTLSRADALRRAVQLAPRDLAVRRQLAGALREAGDHEQAFEQSLQCFDVAKTLAEQESILQWILDWYEDDLDRERLLDHLESARLQAADPSNLTHCVALLLERMGRPTEAIDVLVGLQRRNPTDIIVLQTLVDLAEATQDWDRAIEFQTAKVQVDNSPGNLEQLARYYRQTGRTEDAAKIWDSLLSQRMSRPQIAAMVDRHLAQGDLFQAQRFVEMGLAQDPNDGMLAYRAAWINMALGQRSASRAAFEQVLKLPSPGTVDPWNAVDQIRQALVAYSQLVTLNDQIEQLGPTNRRVQQELFSPPIADGGNSRTIDGIQLYSAVALVTMVPPTANRVSHPWIQQVITDPHPSDRQVELATLASWLTQDDQSMAQLAERGKEMPAVQWIIDLTGILDPPRLVPSVAADRGELSGELSRHLDRLKSAFAEELIPVQRYAVAQILNDSASSQQSDMVSQQISATQSLGSLAAWTPCVKVLHAETVARSFRDRVAELMTTVPVERTDESDLFTVLDGFLHIARFDVAEDVRIIQEGVGKYLRRSTFAATEPSTIGAGQSGAWDSLFVAVGQRWQVDLEQFRAQQRRDAVIASDPAWLDRQRRATAQRQVWQSFRSGVFGTDEQLVSTTPRIQWKDSAATDNTQYFPFSSPELDERRLTILKQIHTGLSDAGSAAPLTEWLADEVATESTDRQTFQLAQATSQWWNGQPQVAIDKLSASAKSHPDELRIQQALVLALIEDRQWDKALAQVNVAAIKASSDAIWIAEWSQLRKLVGQGWATDALVQDLKGHTGAVTSLAFHPTGRQLATASVDGTVRIWDVDSGATHQVIDDHHDIVLAVAYDPSGTWLASAGYDRVIRLRPANGDQPAVELTGHGSAIRALAFSLDGQQLISGADDRTIRVWDLASGKQLREWEAHQNGVSAIAMLQGAQAISAGGDLRLRRWNVETGEELASDSAGPQVTRQLVVDRVSDTVVTSLGEAGIAIWNIGQQPWKVTRQPTDAIVRSIGPMPGTSLLLLGRDDHMVSLWDTTKGFELSLLAAHRARVTGVAYSEATKRVATAAFDGAVRLWDGERLSQSVRAETPSRRDARSGPGSAVLGAAATPRAATPVGSR